MEEKQFIKLVKSAKKGSNKAFEEILIEKSPAILFHAKRILSNHHDAEDAAQEVVVRMYRGLKNLKDPKAFNGWMHKIISNVCYTMGRSKMNSRNDSNIEDHMTEIMEEDREFLPQEFAENEELKAALMEIIQDLPEHRRRAVLMYYYDDMSYKEIAYAMDDTIGTVATNLSKAKKEIKKQLESRTNKKIEYNGQMAALPVVTQVLNEFNATEFTNTDVTNFIASCMENIKASGIPLTSHFLTAKKIVAIATISSVLTVTGSLGILTATGNFNAEDGFKNVPASSEEVVTKQNDFTADGEIVFVGGSEDSEHVNPTGATVEYKDIDAEKGQWSITKKTDKTVVDKGTGYTADSGLNKLIETGADGDYTVKFTVIDKYDNKMHVQRDFSIITQ